MTEIHTMHPAYLAWKAAWRMRCCPPDALLFGKNTRELQRHLRTCPWCSEERQQHLTETFSFPEIKPTREKTKLPSPGELWSLKQELGGWGPKNRYYAPPLVVIIASHKHSVEVCQTYGDTQLAGEDDLEFESNKIGFCQPWNRYTLRLEDLASCFGAVFSSIDQRFFTAGKKQEQPFETGSLLWFFRQMEVETGFFFATKAVATLMNQYENNIQTVAQQLKKHGLNLPKQLPDTLHDLVLKIKIPDEMLPMAAADKEAPQEYGLLLTLENNTVSAPEFIGLHISHWQREGPLLHVSGSFSSPLPPNSTAHFRLITKNRYFDPVPGEFGVKDDFFWTLFQINDTDIDQGEYIVRIITEKQ